MDVLEMFWLNWWVMETIKKLLYDMCIVIDILIMSTESPEKKLSSVESKISDLGFKTTYEDELQINLNTEDFLFQLIPNENHIEVSFVNVEPIEGLVERKPREIPIENFDDWFDMFYKLLAGSYLHWNAEMTSKALLMSYTESEDEFYAYNRDHTIDSKSADSVSVDDLHWHTQNIWSSDFEIQRPNGNPDLGDQLKQESLQAITIREQDHYSTVYNYIFKSVVLVVFYDPVGDHPEIGLKPLPSESMILPTMRSAKEVIHICNNFDGTHKILAERI